MCAKLDVMARVIKLLQVPCDPRGTRKTLGSAVLAVTGLVLLAGCSQAQSQPPRRAATGHLAGRAPGRGASAPRESSPQPSVRAPLPTVGSATSIAQSSLARCASSGLDVSVVPGGGAAGTITGTLVFRNATSSRCTLGGYPGLQLLSLTGAKMPTNVVRGGSGPTGAGTAQVLVVAPGAAVVSQYSYSDVPSGAETSCPTSAKMEVTPPNSYGYVVVDARLTACGGGTIHVGPVENAQPGSG